MEMGNQDVSYFYHKWTSYSNGYMRLAGKYYKWTSYSNGYMRLAGKFYCTHIFIAII